MAALPTRSCLSLKLLLRAPPASTLWKSQSKVKTGLEMDASVVVASCHDGHMTPPPARPSLSLRCDPSHSGAANQPSSRRSLCVYIFLACAAAPPCCGPLRSPCCVCCVPWEYTARIHNREAGESFEYLRGRQGAV